MKFILGNDRQSLVQQLKMFDQREFVQNLNNPQLDAGGYYFVPKACEKRKCLLHIYFHGCMTGRLVLHKYANKQSILNLLL